ncbi:MAG: ribonuclease R [Selenomonadaceae bacterium]|nr:ribonuclease R [Selenomonadaceae bacterium]
MGRIAAEKYHHDEIDGGNGGRNRHGGGDGKICGRGVVMKAVIGKLGVNVKGFGFVTPEDGGADIFIAPENLREALNGDTVKVKIFFNGGRREGSVVEVLEHANKIVVGSVSRVGKNFFVTPDDRRITQKILLTKVREKIPSHTKVVVEIFAWNPLRGHVVEVLGKENAPGVEVRGILVSHGVEENFPPEVQAEVARVELEPSAEEISKRVDRRALKIVTIDGEDAKDLDDGVFAEERDGEFFLGVYIADVSHYVRPHTFLDKEAFARATSIYPVDRVVPMLPPELSNGICSLNAGVDRLAMACEMKLNSSGRVVDYKIFPTVIHVHRRLSYTQVNKFLGGEKILADCADNLNALKKIHGLRKKIREARGAIDFNLPEMKIILDAAGKPIEITKRIQSVGESIIEECMLLANETVAEHTLKKKIPSVYRVHELPNPEKVLTLNNLLAHFSLHISKASEPRDFQKILAKVKGMPAEKVITSYALRTMQQARYSPENLGHFGLAAEFYTHFTSPIRRYPDLIVHRMLRASFGGKKISDKNLEEISRQSSERERRAIEIERETLDLKATEFMQQFVGKKFDGVIESVTSFGFFVELENGVDGLVRAADIRNDYYAFVEREFALIGQATGKSFHIGDRVRVKLISADTKLRQLTFELVNEVTDDDLIAEGF